MVQECVEMGSPGREILAAAGVRGVPLKAAKVCSCGEGFVPHGSRDKLLALCGMDEDRMVEKALEVTGRGRKEET